MTTHSAPLQEFLHLCLQSQWDAGALTKAASMADAGHVDWTELLPNAQAQRLSPLLYHILREQSFVPPQTLQSLKAAYNYIARYNLFLFGELAKILKSFSTQGMQVLVLKGAALAQVVYANPALRPLRDIDLLVRRQDVPHANRVLKELGYVVPQVQERPGSAEEYESQLMFFKPAPKPSQIEIHWSLIDSPFYQRTLRNDWFWESALPFSTGKDSARKDFAGKNFAGKGLAMMLGPEAQTLYLCAHLFLHHGGKDLLWRNDIAQLIRFYREQLDWEVLLKHAQALGLSLPTQRVLTTIASEWNVPIPPAILEQLKQLSVSTGEAEIALRMSGPRRSPASRLWGDLSIMPGWRRRLSFAWLNLVPSGEYMRHRYRISNELLLPLYYPYRWWRGFSGLFNFSSPAPTSQYPQASSQSKMPKHDDFRKEAQ